MPLISGKRAATSPLNSDFEKRPKLGLSDKELKALNEELQDVIHIPISRPEAVESRHLAHAFREVARQTSNIDKTWRDIAVCKEFVDRLSSQERLDVVRLWIEAREKGQWERFANHFLFQAETPSAVFSMDRELIEDLPHLVLPVQSEKATMESWDVAYVGNADDLLYDHIATYSKDTDNYARYTSIVQSSGMGKSRAVDEFSRKHLVVPLNLRQNPDGFPPPDGDVRDWLLQSKTKMEAFSRACAFLCAMFVILLRDLQEIDAKVAAVSSVIGVDSLPAKFRLLMTMDQTFSHQGPTRRGFYRDVLQLASEMQLMPSPPTGSTLQSSPKLSLKKGTSKQIYDLKEELKKLMAFLIPGFDVMNTYPPALIISFDEAHALATVEVNPETPPWSRFYEFRRALRVIQSYPCFSVFLATTGKINQFMPDPGDSSRVQKELLRLIIPFCELGYDQLAEKVVSNETTLDDVASLKVMASLSRPLFATRYMKGDEDVRKSIVKFAGEKLLCKAFPSSKSSVAALEHVEQMACISVRIPLEFNLRSRDMEKTLVERHLRVCLHVDPGFETAVTIAPSEPLLAEASSLIMNNSTFDLPGCLLKELERQGLDKGNRGELIGMTLCLLARDAAAKELDNRVIPVTEFIRHLVVGSDQILDSKPVRARTLDEAQKTFKDTFRNSKIFFNHFVKFRHREVINRRYLWRLIARGAAGLCADYQSGVDIVIPFLFWNDRLCRKDVSALFIQCKNDGTFQITPRQYLFDMMNPYHIQFFDEKEKESEVVPVIRMVFALASPHAGMVVLKNPGKTQPPRPAAYKAKFQVDKYTSFDIWCAKASQKTFLPVKEDDVYEKLLLRFRVFPDVYAEKRTVGLQNVTRSMNPGTDIHPAHYRTYAPFLDKQ